MKRRLLLSLFGLLPVLLRAQEAAQGSVELGYRAVSGQGGSIDAYRSVVNLGQGPKLFHLDFSAPRPKGKWFDRLSLRADSWGGEPYNTTSFEMGRATLYRLTASYRNLAQFNRLPSFALGQQALDVKRRDGEFEFAFKPRATVSPFFAWSANSGLGGGIANFVTTGNEYPVAGTLEDRTDLFRGGVRVSTARYHATIEQGGLRYRQRDGWQELRPNAGNVTAPFFGTPLRLESLDQQYRIDGGGYYSKAVASANPASWLDISGSYLYSRPSRDIDYSERATGRFASLNPLRFTTTQTGTIATSAQLPRSSGWVAVEARPHERVRIVESWLTDRLNQSLDVMRWTHNRQQLDGFVDVAKGLTLRGGHRYEWGEARSRLPQLLGPESTELRRHVGLAGVRFQAGRGLVASSDVEIGRSDAVYSRTSARDFYRWKGQVRLQPAPSLSVAGNWLVFDSVNPSPLGRLDWLSRSQSVTLSWLPKGGQKVSLWGGYSRATIASDVPYLIPQSFARAQSIYRERSHTVTAMAETALGKARIGAGGAAFVSAGTRPTRLYEPTGRLIVPLNKKLSAKAEWRYHGMAEPGFFFDAGANRPFVSGIEGFRAHLWVFALLAQLR